MTSDSREAERLFGNLGLPQRHLLLDEFNLGASVLPATNVCRVCYFGYCV